MTQATFELTRAGASQNELIEVALRLRVGEWVAMPWLARVGSGNDGFCMVHSRIADLRKRGLVIEQRSERKDGKVHSFYRLISDSDSFMRRDRGNTTQTSTPPVSEEACKQRDPVLGTEMRADGLTRVSSVPGSTNRT